MPLLVVLLPRTTLSCRRWTGMCFALHTPPSVFPIKRSCLLRILVACKERPSLCCSALDAL